jgi:hypothetical protein
VAPPTGNRPAHCRASICVQSAAALGSLVSTDSLLPVMREVPIIRPIKEKTPPDITASGRRRPGHTGG